MGFGLGAARSQDDARDYSVQARSTQFPAQFEQVGKSGVYNQGSVGSCVAHACAEASETHDGKRKSTHFLYGNRVDEPDHSGMTVREAMSTLVKKGDPIYSDCPGNAENPEAYRAIMRDIEKLIPLAAPYKAQAYARLYSADEVKETLLSGGKVVIAIAVYHDFDADSTTGILQNSVESGLRGHHAMLVTGWKNGYFHVQNSWGRDWGKEGFCWIRQSWFITQDQVCEAWALTYPAKKEEDLLIRRTLKRGMAGDDVKLMQDMLKEKGYSSVGASDGLFGSKTQDALKAFQKRVGLIVDGICGVKTWAALEEETNEPESETVLIQKRLHDWGFGGIVGSIDGVNGKKTIAAIKQFQSAMGLVADGIVGAKTWAALGQEIIVPRITERDMSCTCETYCDGYPQTSTAGVRLLIERIWRELEAHYPGAQVFVTNREHPAPDGAIAGGQRCPVWNRVRGGATASQHLYGTAADIYAKVPGLEDSFVRNQLETIALALNPYGGVGTGAHYIVHVDVRGKKSRWAY